tara:strand:- start:1154 stop:2044 length:891 start_codon:yes stop_codon:yes gene_type:complete
VGKIFKRSNVIVYSEKAFKVRMSKNNKIGFMQGRLSPVIKKRIQIFPDKNWKNEFKIASKIGFSLMEWTIDTETLKNNPLFYKGKLKEILSLKKKYNFRIESLTLDYLMENPIWKKYEKKIFLNFKKIIENSGKIGIKNLIVPLVDNGSIKSNKELKNLYKICKSIEKLLIKNKQRVLFEIDLSPNKVKNFISKFNKKLFGINYDLGNSASLNFNVSEEFKFYSNYIFNIHIKDRKLFGNTVELGKGNVNFKKFFSELNKTKYKGNFILQTARSKSNNHAKDLKRYKSFLEKGINI